MSGTLALVPPRGEGSARTSPASACGPGTAQTGGAAFPSPPLTSQSSSYLTLSVIFHNMASGVPQNSRQLNPGSPHPPSGKSTIGVTVARRLPPPPPRAGLAVLVTGRASVAVRVEVAAVGV